MSSFIQMAIAAYAIKKKQGTFQCSICQSTAIAMKSSVNRHMMANCLDCKTSIRQ